EANAARKNSENSVCFNYHPPSLIVDIDQLVAFDFLFLLSLPRSGWSIYGGGRERIITYRLNNIRAYR
ncbi:MAG: hypothetical protein M3115_01610, partial [Thermoproteota archaeon]|nr:hypothetical protein [Thermoproteota archaeon]